MARRSRSKIALLELFTGSTNPRAMDRG